MRCFVAFDLPRPVRNHLAKVTAPLRERYDIRWVPPEQMHVTVLFAGNQRPSFLVITALFVIGLVLLQRVPNPKVEGAV